MLELETPSAAVPNAGRKAAAESEHPKAINGALPTELAEMPLNGKVADFRLPGDSGVEASFKENKDLYTALFNVSLR